MKTKFKLYVSPYKELDENVPYSYFSAESGYMLAFSDKPIDGMQEVPLGREERLKESEKEWLRKCKLAVNIRAMQDNAQEYTSILNVFLQNVEKELEKITKV